MFNKSFINTHKSAFEIQLQNVLEIQLKNKPHCYLMDSLDIKI